MTREQVSLSILHKAPYGLALGLGLSHFVGHLQFLLLFLPVWDQKVKAELLWLMAGTLCMWGSRGTLRQRGNMAEDLSNLGGVALLQNSFPHPSPSPHHPTHKSPTSVLLCGTLQSLMIPQHSQEGFYAVFQHLLLAPVRQECQVPFWAFIALHELHTEMRITSQGSLPASDLPQNISSVLPIKSLTGVCPSETSCMVSGAVRKSDRIKQKRKTACPFTALREDQALENLSICISMPGPQVSGTRHFPAKSQVRWIRGKVLDENGGNRS